MTSRLDISQGVICLPMGLIVHHLGHSQSDRIVWLCEELGVDYELKKYDRAPALAPKDYKVS